MRETHAHALQPSPWARMRITCVRSISNKQACFLPSSFAVSLLLVAVSLCLGVGPADESSHYKHDGRKSSVEYIYLHRWFLAILDDLRCSLSHTYKPSHIHFLLLPTYTILLFSSSTAVNLVATAHLLTLHMVEFIRIASKQ